MISKPLILVQEYLMAFEKIMHLSLWNIRISGNAHKFRLRQYQYLAVFLLECDIDFQIIGLIHYVSRISVGALDSKQQLRSPYFKSKSALLLLVVVCPQVPADILHFSS